MPLRSVEQVRHADEVLRVGDCVLVNPDDVDARPYIGKIKDIHGAAHGEARLRLAWFYRPEEAVGGRKDFHGEKELFSSDHLDDIEKSTVIAKCHVHTLKRYEELKTVGEHDYYARFHYRPATREFDPDQVPVFCSCELPYNPDRYMIMCDSCEEWYHPECLQQSGGSMRGLRHWLCPSCSGGGQALPAGEAAPAAANGHGR